MTDAALLYRPIHNPMTRLDGGQPDRPADTLTVTEAAQAGPDTPR